MLKTLVVLLLLDWSRYFIAIIPPPTAREMLIRLTDLPIPLIVWEGKAWDQCSGFICMDYSARASGRLSRKDCQRALGAAAMQDYLPLPFREDPGQPRPQRDDWPDKGYYRFITDDSERRVAWIDSVNCRVFASYADW